MPRSQDNKRKKPAAQRPGESRAAVALTVAWTVSVITVLVCDFFIVVVHLLARRPEGADWAIGMGWFLLFSGCMIGVVSLALLPVVLRVRRTLPPQGLVGFAVLVAVAPLVALAVRLLR